MGLLGMFSRGERSVTELASGFMVAKGSQYLCVMSCAYFEIQLHLWSGIFEIEVCHPKCTDNTGEFHFMMSLTVPTHRWAARFSRDTALS